ncbi:dienelactone hydrolase family protein [Rhodoferax sp. GW822-FHT02A01]|uniref:dienelactone hydrolase family protein n=1 Tax=Rhodoferax sp. GW822-FHT02A01 TaxID=3141537 RepID=UPI00315C50CA
MNDRTISIASHDGRSFDAYMSLPPTGRGPGLLILQEIWGVNAHIRAVADQYAMDGYVVLAPDVFWRQQPRVDLGYDEEGSKQARNYMMNLDAPNTVLDLQSAAQVLRGLPELDGAVGAVGYCMGGRLAYALAATGAIDAAVCYYGGRIQDNLGIAPSIQVPILFHYAERDAHIPMTAVEAVKAAFAGRSNAEFHVYPGVDHGFNCWGRPMYNQRASALAHGRTLQWLAEKLV